MFKNWGFLLGEIWVLILLALLLGLLAGWLIWGGRKTVQTGLSMAEGDRLRADLNAANAAKAKLSTDLDACRKLHAEKDARIAELAQPVAPAPAPAPAPVAAPTTDAAVDYDGDGILEGTDEGTKPATLSAARDGAPDDLKQIKGIGPKLEALCNRLGFYHFDQIAAWTDQEVAWVDANLEGFKGRVSRDNWVSQARILASGGTTEFSARVKDGDVY